MARSMALRQEMRYSKKPKLGTGERFASLKSKLAKKPGVTSPGGLAAYIGRQKYGGKKMAAMAAKGRSK